MGQCSSEDKVIHTDQYSENYTVANGFKIGNLLYKRCFKNILSLIIVSPATCGPREKIQAFLAYGRLRHLWLQHYHIIFKNDLISQVSLRSIAAAPTHFSTQNAFVPTGSFERTSKVATNGL